jgi:hypothetical protein
MSADRVRTPLEQGANLADNSRATNGGQLVRHQHAPLRTLTFSSGRSIMSSGADLVCGPIRVHGHNGPKPPNAVAPLTECRL